MAALQPQTVLYCHAPVTAGLPLIYDNMAYFDQEVSLSDMLAHIYGNKSILRANNRPNLFVKELKMYIDYFRNEISNITGEITNAQLKKWTVFKANLLEGIAYYENLFSSSFYFQEDPEKIKYQFDFYKLELATIKVPTCELV